MNKRGVLIAVVAFLAAAGVAYLGRTLYLVSARPTAPQMPVFANASDAVALEEVRDYLTPSTSEERATLPNRLVEAARPESPTARELALLEVFRQRIAILVDPDYDRYIDHIASVTGKRDGAIRAELGAEHQRLWEAVSRQFRDASFGLDGCELLPGSRDLIAGGGQIATRRDPGVYGSGGLLANPDAELRRVQVPILLAVDFDGKPRTVLVHLVSAFVWDDARSVWIPYITGVYDPTSQEDILPGPWM